MQRARVAIIAVCLLFSAACRSTLGPADRQRIAGKTYVITGASSGFGRGMATALGAHGANVVLAARRTELLEEVAADVRKAGGTPLVVTTDVSRPEEVQRLADEAVAASAGSTCG